MDSFAAKLAVVTGGGSGMGRELVRQLAAQGCSVASCDLNADTLAETVAMAQPGAPPGVEVTAKNPDAYTPSELVNFDLAIFEYATPKELPGVNTMLVMPPPPGQAT